MEAREGCGNGSSLSVIGSREAFCTGGSTGAVEGKRQKSISERSGSEGQRHAAAAGFGVQRMRRNVAGRRQDRERGQTEWGEGRSCLMGSGLCEKGDREGVSREQSDSERRGKQEGHL